MKLICSQVELSNGLKTVSRAVPLRPTHPVLANVLLTTDANTSRLNLMGFDLTLGIQTSIAASVGASGSITVPARLLSDIVARLSSDDLVTISTIESNDGIIISTKSGRYELSGLTADDYPDFPKLGENKPIQIKASSLIDCLHQTCFASSKDENKQVLTGVHFKFTGTTLETAATDGHRLSTRSISNSTIEPINENQDKPYRVTIPSKSLKEVSRFLSDPSELIHFIHKQNQVAFKWGDYSITSSILDGDYPQYESLIPKSFSRKFAVDRKNLTLILERISVLVDYGKISNNVIRLSINSKNNQIEIKADAQEIGKGTELLPAIISGESIDIAFNVKYLLDGIKVIKDEQVMFQCNGATTGVILSPYTDQTNYTYLVLPVQVRT